MLKLLLVLFISIVSLDAKIVYTSYNNDSASLSYDRSFSDNFYSRSSIMSDISSFLEYSNINYTNFGIVYNVDPENNRLKFLGYCKSSANYTNTELGSTLDKYNQNFNSMNGTSSYVSMMCRIDDDYPSTFYYTDNYFDDYYNVDIDVFVAYFFSNQELDAYTNFHEDCMTTSECEEPEECTIQNFFYDSRDSDKTIFTDGIAKNYTDNKADFSGYLSISSHLAEIDDPPAFKDVVVRKDQDYYFIPSAAMSFIIWRI